MNHKRESLHDKPPRPTPLDWRTSGLGTDYLDCLPYRALELQSQTGYLPLVVVNRFRKFDLGLRIDDDLLHAP